MGARVLFVVKEIEGAEPLGALYVAGCLERAGHTCRFVGTRGNDVLAEVRRFDPHIVAVGATTGLHRYYLGLLARIKEERPQCLTLMGGPHPTHHPDVIATRGARRDLPRGGRGPRWTAISTGTACPCPTT